MTAWGRGQGPVPLQLLPEGHQRFGAHQVCGVPRLRPVPAVLRGRARRCRPTAPTTPTASWRSCPSRSTTRTGGWAPRPHAAATGLLTAADAAARSLCDQFPAAAGPLSCVIWVFQLLHNNLRMHTSRGGGCRHNRDALSREPLVLLTSSEVAVFAAAPRWTRSCCCWRRWTCTGWGTGRRWGSTATGRPSSARRTTRPSTCAPLPSRWPRPRPRWPGCAPHPPRCSSCCVARTACRRD